MKATWKLDAATSNMALEIIRQREAQFVEQRIELFQAGGSTPENREASKATREKAATELQLLLGPARSNELTRLEEEIAAEKRK